jgi:predicted Fe-Mo cluster-binding NifX family protein
MDGLAPFLPDHVLRIALPVMGSGAGAPLCPFFGKCDGLLLLSRDGRPAEFHPNETRTADGLCDLIMKSGANAMICGFIGEAEKRKLLDAGIDVRLGSCACSVDQLVAEFDALPPA